MKKLLLLCIAVSLISVAYSQRTFKKMPTAVSTTAKKHSVERMNAVHAGYGKFLEKYLKNNPGNKTAEDLLERFNAGKNIGAVMSKQMQSNSNFKVKQKQISDITPLPQGMGGAVVINGNSIQTLDSQTNTLHGPFLNGYADDDDNVFVKVSPDGKMAFTLNFDYGQYISFIDISNPANPQLVGNFGFDYDYYIECFTISNDGKYLIVADDDGVENYIDVIDIKTDTDVKYLHLSSWSDWTLQPNAIAISPDDKTILVSGVSDSKIGYSVLQFDSNNLSLSETQPFTPVENLISGISFTPDGQTAIIDGFPGELVYTVTSPGQITGENFVTPGDNPIFAISSVISNDGKKLYCYDYASGGIYIFNINGSGDITYSNNFIPRYLSDSFLPYAFFQDNIPGYPVQDILAIDGSGSILYANLMQNIHPAKPANNLKHAPNTKVINGIGPTQPDVILEIDLSNNQVAGVLNLASSNWDGMSIAASKNISFESVAVTSPAGGENWQTATAHNITWQSKNVNNVNIQLSTNNGANWSTIANNLSASSGTYNWIITPLPYSNQCLIKVSDASNPLISGISNLFTISSGTFESPINGITLLQPNGGENWKGGTTQYIVFRKNAFFPSVKLEFTTDDGATWHQILSYPLSGLTYYPWTVPLVNSSKCRIRVSNWNSPLMNAVSASDFTITSNSSASNYPNPFNPSTTIRFNMLASGHASVKIYNSLGQQVAELVNRDMGSGVHEVRFDATNYPSGVYYYEVDANGNREVKKMLYLK